MTTELSVEIRLEIPEDHADVRRVTAAAFDPEPVADLVEAVRSSEQYEPELEFVAVADGRIVGHVMISYATLQTGDGHHRVAMLSPLAVEPEFQRQGIGTKLVHCALDKARSMGELMVVLEGDPSYYRRFGFEPSHQYGITLPLPSWATNDAGQVVWLSEPQHFDSATVVYPPAFELVSE